MTPSKPASWLYVEDSMADSEFLTTAFRRESPAIHLTIVDSGAGAMALLLKGLESGELPGLILLDLKMPGMDGHEVLSAIKRDPRLRSIPVVVLTSSRLDEDILRAYDIGANCYLPKPDDALGYNALARELSAFWADLALLPPGPRS